MAKWKSPYKKGPGTQREREGRLSKAKTQAERERILSQYGPRAPIDETSGVPRRRQTRASGALQAGQAALLRAKKSKKLSYKARNR